MCPRKLGSSTSPTVSMRRRARLGELAGDATDLHDRHAERVGQHDRHLQDDAQLLTDVDRRELLEALGAVAGLQQERVAGGDLGQRRLQRAGLAGEHQRGIAGDLLQRPIELAQIGPVGLLIGGVRLPRRGCPAPLPRQKLYRRRSSTWQRVSSAGSPADELQIGARAASARAACRTGTGSSCRSTDTTNWPTIVVVDHPDRPRSPPASHRPRRRSPCRRSRMPLSSSTALHGRVGRRRSTRPTCRRRRSTIVELGLQLDGAGQLAGAVESLEVDPLALLGDVHGLRIARRRGRRPRRRRRRAGPGAPGRARPARAQDRRRQHRRARSGAR